MKFEVKGGGFGYGSEPVIKDISFTVEDGEVLAILGPNGVGKTTLLKCMMGLQKWKNGVTEIDGSPIESLSSREIWKTLAYVPQSKGTALSYTAFDMVLMGCSTRLGLFEQPSKEETEIARQAMDEVGILHLQKKQCSKMSGGELQMVLIARALASRPRILVLDEPESNLDFKNQLIILDIIQKLAKKRGIASIVNTHYPAHALKIADKALILYRDRKHSYGDAEETITEKNMARAFSVEVKISELQYQNQQYKSVIPIRALEVKEGETL